MVCYRDFVRAVIDDADYLDALDEGLLDGEDDDNDSWEQARRGAGKGREQSSREKVERRQENVIMLGGFLGASARVRWRLAGPTAAPRCLEGRG